MKILLVEDEVKLSNFIQKGLSEEFYYVDVANNGYEGEKLAKNEEYDLIILDVMLPGKSGFAVCKSIRSFDENIPILMLTALDSSDDKAEGFEKGADDYLVKPFEFRELLYRIKALTRRKNNLPHSSKLSIADLELDTYSKTVIRGSSNIELTPKEYDLLQYLLINKKRVVSRTELYENIWKDSAETNSNSVDVYITFLRRKVDKNFTQKLIHTRVGIGYVLTDSIIK